MITPEKKILITGCGGMLGEAVYNHFSKICKVYATDIDINESWLSYMDVSKYDLVLKKALEVRPDYIFHLAALTDMEYCEKNPEHAYAVNTMGTENVAMVCKKLDIPMISISTAGMFDGKKESYIDFDDPLPLSVYGKSKYAGDMSITRILKKYFIFRPGWMIGGGPRKDKKFVNKIVKQLVAGKKELNVVEDKVGTPTYTYDLAKTIHEVVNKAPFGLYNAACEGSGSRYDIAKFILKHKSLDKKVKLKKVSSNFFAQEYFAPRPYSETLINFKQKFRNINISRDWKICLGEYLDKFDWGI